MGPGEKNPEIMADELLNQADQDMSVDDLTRGTEVYEEYDEDVDGEEGDPAELDFEPKDDYASNGFDYNDVSDAYVGEDDY